MGGKRCLADRLIPLFPPHECYVEVFAGGGALYFLRPQPAPVEVLNDINGDLVTLYRVVQNHLEEFVRQFKWALSSRQIFECQKMTRPETLTDIQRAARFFYLQHHAFGGKVSGQSSVPQQLLLQSTCCELKKPCLQVMTGRTPSTTWTHLTGGRWIRRGLSV